MRLPLAIASVVNGIARFKKCKKQNNYLITDIYSRQETSGGKSYKLYLNVNFFNTSVN